MATKKKSEAEKTAAKPAKKPAAKSAPKKGKEAAKAAAPKKEKAAAAPVARGPLARLKALHGSKEELVKKIVEPLAGPEEDTDALGERLRKASNAQLLRLARVVETVKSKYGGRDGLVQALAKLQAKAKDNDYLAKLGTFSLPKLWDMARSIERRARAQA